MIHHVALSVADLDRSSEFYRTALGMEVQLAFELPGFKAAMLATPDGMRVELFQAEGSTRSIDSSGPLEVMKTQGYTHFALEVERVEASYGALMAAGATSVWDPRESPEPGMTMAFVQDPDGNLIELVGPAA